MNRCPYCALDNRDAARFCQNCGKPLPQPAAPQLVGGAVDVAPSTSPSETTLKPAVSPVIDLQTAPRVDAGEGRASSPAAQTAPPEPVALPAAEGLLLISAGRTGDTTPMAGPPPAEAAPAVPNETASAAATVPLPVEPPAFAALPVGALLDNRRYEVTDVISEGTKLNAYRVADYGGVHCPQCGSGDNAPNESFCASCGATLPPGPATYLLRETCEPDIWEGEKVLIERRLWHKGLVNVDRLFVERPYGNVQRFYLVSEQEEGESLAALPRPQTEDKVLLWGKDLAEAVAYLNDAGIRHGGIRAASVRLVNDQVKLTNFGRAEKVRSRIEGKDWPVEEVAELAHMLRDDLLAGQTLSPQAAAVFEKALSADKTVRYPSGNALAEDIGKALQASQRIESVTLFVGRYSHVGAVRDHNEDCLLTLEIQRVQLSESRPLGLYLVADGMGGHEAGDIASSLAVNAAARVVANKLILPWVDNQTPLDYEQLLKEAFQQANQAVNERRLKARTDMGTTLVGALVVGMDAFVANIGDSRCYCLSGGKLQQITTDHSLVERMVATKQITRAEARVHPQRNYIYRTVGDKPQVEVDTFKVSLKPGDYLVSCSDGLNSMIEDEQIQQAVLESPHPQAACERLVQLANEAGGDDNVTVIVLQALESKKQGRETP